MDYLLYLLVIVGFALFLYGMLVGAEDKAAGTPAMPQDEPHDETPELAPDIYAAALAYLLIDAELRGVELVERRRGDDEAGKGMRV